MFKLISIISSLLFFTVAVFTSFISSATAAVEIQNPTFTQYYDAFDKGVLVVEWNSPGASLAGHIFECIDTDCSEYTVSFEDSGNQYRRVFKGLIVGKRYRIRLNSVDDSSNIYYPSPEGWEVVTISQPSPTADVNASINWVMTDSAYLVVSLPITAEVDIEFGESTAYGGAVRLSGIKTAHSHIFYGLKPNTTYHYRIGVRDFSEYPEWSQDFTFTTRTEMTFTDPEVEIHDPNTVTIHFDTNVDCMGRIPFFNNTSGPDLGIPQTIDEPKVVKDHSVVLFNLTPGAHYFYHLECIDSSGGVGEYRGTNNLFDFMTPIEVEVNDPPPAEEVVPIQNDPVIVEPAPEQPIQQLPPDYHEPGDVANKERALESTPDPALIDRLSGQILLQVEEAGEAWYVDPNSKEKFFLRNGSSAYEALRKFGLGITNADLARIPIGGDQELDLLDSDNDGLSDGLEEAIGTNPFLQDSDGDSFTDAMEISNGYNPLGSGRLPYDQAFADSLRGKILLQVEQNGEAWYVNPEDGKRYYMKDGETAYQIMRFLSLGITNENLRKIPVGDL